MVLRFIAVLVLLGQPSKSIAATGSTGTSLDVRNLTEVRVTTFAGGLDSRDCKKRNAIAPLDCLDSNENDIYNCEDCLHDDVGSAARFNQPSDIAVDAAGRFALVTDRSSNVIRRIELRSNGSTIAGSVSTIAGNFSAVSNKSSTSSNRPAIPCIDLVGSGSSDSQGYPDSWDCHRDGVGSAARFLGPSAVAMDAGGRVALVVDVGNQVLRKIDLADNSVTTIGNTSSLRTNGYECEEITNYNDGRSNIFIINPGCDRDGAGSAARFQLKPESGIAMDAKGEFALLADTGNRVIRRIDLKTLAVTTIAGNSSAEDARLPTDKICRSPKPGEMAENVPIANPNCFRDGVGSAARFNHPAGITLATGFALVTDLGMVRRIDLTTLAVTTIAGNISAPCVGPRGFNMACIRDGVGRAASFMYVTSITVDDAQGVALVTEPFGNVVRHIDLVTLAVTTVAGEPGISGSADDKGLAARFNMGTLGGIVGIEMVGSIAFVVDTGNNAIRKLSWCAKGAALLAGGGCTACSAGQYSDAALELSCKRCSAARFQSAPGQTSCKGCEAGKFRTNGTADTSRPENEACQACPAGQMNQLSDQTACTACPAAQFNAHSGQTNCGACPCGKFTSAATGFSSCTKCGAGSTAAPTCSASCSISCPAGQFLDGTSFSCTACQAGKFRDARQDARAEPDACQVCPAGQYQPAAGELSCTGCAAGQFRDAQNANASSDERQACQACPKGQVQPAVGELACATCLAGLLWGGEGQAECTNAPLSAALGAIFAAAFAALFWRRRRRLRALRDGSRDEALLASYVPPKDVFPGSVQAQLRLFEIESKFSAVGEQGLGDPAGDIGACFEEVRAALAKATAGASLVQLRAVARCAGKEHKAAYMACHDIVQTDAGHAQLLSSSAAAAKKHGGHPHQTIGDLYWLQMQAREVLPVFVDRMRGIVAGFASRRTKKKEAAVELHTSPPKHLYRCMEKMCLKPGAERLTCTNVCDVVRCIIECDDCGLMAEVIQALLACPGVVVTRVKDRANHVTSMHWMDVMVNLTLVGDASVHVCEVQIVHTKMLVARSTLGGHGPYGKLRAATEILALRASMRGSRRASAQEKMLLSGGSDVVAAAAAAAANRGVVKLPTIQNPMRSAQPATFANLSFLMAAVSAATVGVQESEAASTVAAAKAQCAGDKVAAAKLITSAVQKALRGLTAARGQDVAVRREPGNAKGNASQEQHL